MKYWYSYHSKVKWPNKCVKFLKQIIEQMQVQAWVSHWWWQCKIETHVVENNKVCVKSYSIWQYLKPYIVNHTVLQDMNKEIAQSPLLLCTSLHGNWILITLLFPALSD